MTAIIVVLAGLLVVAAAAAVVAFVSLGILREERRLSLTRRAPGPLSQATRLVTGHHVRLRSDQPAPGQDTTV